MARTRSGPTMGRLTVLIGILVAGVVFYRSVSSIQLDLVSKQSHNRAFYEKLYPEAIDEIAEWRQRYDNESAIVQQHVQLLSAVVKEAKRLQEENEKLKAEVISLKEELKRNGAIGAR